MENLINDELKVYRGKDYIVNDKISIHQPSLGEIDDYGEQAYFNMIYDFTAVPADMMWQLDEIGVDYTKINDFELFSTVIFSKYTKNDTCILFGNDLDLKQFSHCMFKDTNEPVLYDEKSGIIIDEYTYCIIVNTLRKIHGLKRNNQFPGNETTRRILIDDAKNEYLLNKDKEYHSQLKSLISTMINSPGFKYDHENVWDMKINAFMDSVKRITKMKETDLLLQSGYSGFGIDLSKLNKEQLNWKGELE